MTVRPTVNPATMSETAARGVYWGSQLRIGILLYSSLRVQPRRARFTIQWTADPLLFPSSVFLVLLPSAPPPGSAPEWWNPLLRHPAPSVCVFSGSGTVTAILSQLLSAKSITYVVFSSQRVCVVGNTFLNGYRHLKEVWVLRFPLWCSWEFHASGTWSCCKG